MTDIAPDSRPIQVEGARFRSPVSEALIQQIGADINYILTLTEQRFTFTSNGIFLVPNVPVATHLQFYGAGGGGGGGSGGAGIPGAGGGAGGSGAQPQKAIHTVVPGETLTITIGSGGAGGAGGNSSLNAGAGNNGSAGNATTVTGSISGLILSFGGGLGGALGLSNFGGGGAGGAASLITARQGIVLLPGGNGAASGVNGGSGQRSCYALGGNGGLGTLNGGSGGGGAGIGVGGNGSNGNNVGTSGVGGVGGISAGGGGSGGGNINSGAGGAGGPGYLEIVYFGPP